MVWPSVLTGAYIPDVNHQALATLRATVKHLFDKMGKYMTREGGVSLLKNGDRETAEIQIGARERHSRLCGGRLESPEIAKPRRTTPRADQTVVEHNDLTEREMPHLGETPVQFAVLRQHPTRSVLEIGGGLGNEIPNSGGSQLVDGHVEPLRGFTELALGVVRQLD